MLSWIQILGVWECSHMRELKQTILMTDFWSEINFRMVKPTFEMLCNEISLLVNPVIQSHSLLKQSLLSLFVVH